MSKLRQKIDELSHLMAEFDLAEASLEGEDWRVSFSRNHAVAAAADQVPGAPMTARATAAEAVLVEGPKGTPVTSPMNGIFYTSPSPNAAAFVKEGESVTAGQVVGLIEAMKVFNEITAPTSGTVTRIVAETGQLVQPGEPLLYIA